MLGSFRLHNSPTLQDLHLILKLPRLSSRANVGDLTMDPSALIQQLNGYPAEALKNDPKARKEALSLSRRLTSALQDPVSEATELVFSVCWKKLYSAMGVSDSTR